MLSSLGINSPYIEYNSWRTILKTLELTIESKLDKRKIIVDTNVFQRPTKSLTFAKIFQNHCEILFGFESQKPGKSQITS